MANSYRQARTFTPHDTNVIGEHTGMAWDAFYVGESVSNDEDVALIPEGQATSVIFKNVLQGTIYPIATNVILSTGTSADDIVVLDIGSHRSCRQYGIL